MKLRPIENESNTILSSPCDGRILSYSEVKNLTDMIVVKDIRYQIGDFLFGNFKKIYPELSEKLYNPNKKYYQITIYLSPGDCHRYFSPNQLYVNSRIYIPGFLEPVKPSYVEKHPRVFATNERVTLKCKQNGLDDPLFITYVGALNVGSISLSFDDFLKTNIKISPEDKKNPGYYVVKYSDIINPSEKRLERPNYFYYKPIAPLLIQELDKDSSEFDMRDMVDLDQDLVKKYKIDIDKIKIPFSLFKEKFLFEQIMHNKEDVNFNYGNNFLSYDLDVHKRKSKLNNPKNLNLEKFRITEEGVYLDKKDEMGWFNFGSTIVLVFSVDKDKEIKFKHNFGDVVRIGENLFNYI
jgi:phosphatidylserine decarboxylase precursor